MNLTSAVSDSSSGREALLAVRNLGIVSRIRGRTSTIVAGVELSVAPGETIGIVGESGSGKSMTGRALLGLLPAGVAATGEVRYQGKNLLELSERELAALRGSKLGLIFQDPFTMLNPLLRCGRHINEQLRDPQGRRLSRRERRAEAIRRLAEVGIDDPGVVDRYPFQLSGGMRQRVGIAAALARDPEILIADEPSTALDVTTQKEILALLSSLQASRGMGMIMITHDLRVAFSICDRVYVLYAGSVLEVGSARELESTPMHPYTLGLLLSEPPVDRRLSDLVAIGGSVPAPDDVVDCCAFSPRCQWVEAECRARKPDLRLVAPSRHTACVRVDQIDAEMRETRRSLERREHIRGAPGAATSLAVLDGVQKSFDGGSRRDNRRVVALAGVSLAIGANESVGLVGESGSGKTTLARCLLGLETPSAGDILVNGIPASNYSALTRQERMRLRQTIQIIFQDPYSSLNPVRTVGSALKEALSTVHPRANNLDSMMLRLLERVGLPAGYANRKPVALSGGERQRVAIARALAVNPKILVCDEPVSALDVSVQAQILNLFKSLRAEFGMSYLFITHDLAVVRQVVDRVYVLYRGEVVESGAVDDVLDHPQHPYTVRLVASVPRSEARWLATS
jgi:peptide/nickel transport system ATP-binding protein